MTTKMATIDDLRLQTAALGSCLDTLAEFVPFSALCSAIESLAEMEDTPVVREARAQMQDLLAETFVRLADAKLREVGA